LEHRGEPATAGRLGPFNVGEFGQAERGRLLAQHGVPANQACDRLLAVQPRRRAQVHHVRRLGRQHRRQGRVSARRPPPLGEGRQSRRFDVDGGDDLRPAVEFADARRVHLGDPAGADDGDLVGPPTTAVRFLFGIASGNCPV
jgi:hypothetical protein